MACSQSVLTNKLVSIVVPAFNAADTIHETVVSALNQTYANIEIIIVDDGSSDSTRAVAAALMRCDSRVR